MRLPVRLVPVLWLAAVLAAASGCGGGHDVAEKQLADMRAELARLRASQAAMTERLDALEIDKGSFRKSAAPATPPTAEGDRPSLDVLRLSPSDGDGDADTDGQRPVIRAVGSDGSIQKGAKTNAPRAQPKKGVAAVATPRKAPSDTDPRPTAKP
jgi:hypothetical protein